MRAICFARVSTKTISLKREAYERLKAARRYPDESFSEVVLRANWPEDTLTACELLQLFRNGRPHLPERLPTVSKRSNVVTRLRRTSGRTADSRDDLSDRSGARTSPRPTGRSVAFLEERADARLYLTFTVAGELAAGASMSRKSQGSIPRAVLRAAATALAYRMPLVTANHVHFERVPGLDVVRY
jgi:predicted nucleic acid-binding protein